MRSVPLETEAPTFAGSPRPLGTLRPRDARSIRSSKWSIGAETQDRNYTIFRNYARFLGPLGAKRARLQGGWHRCDPNGTGVFDFDWLDEAVYGLASRGIKPWIELSYGNHMYAGGGGDGPGAWLPNTTAALNGFGRWAAALVARYANVTDEFEIWNEPKLSPSNYAPYAQLAATACAAAHRGRRTAVM